MDLAKAADVAQIVSVFPGLYCAFETWASLHQQKIAIPTGAAVPIASISLPVAIRALLALLLVGVILRILSLRKPTTETEKRIDRPFSEEEKMILRDVQRQVDNLTRFELFAIAQLILTSGMTGTHFYDLILNQGFPILTLEQSRALMATFEHIATRTTFLDSDPSGQWTVRKQYKPLLSLVVKENSPIFGV